MKIEPLTATVVLAFIVACLFCCVVFGRDAKYWQEQYKMCSEYVNTLEAELERLNTTNETEPLHIECEGEKQ